MVSTSMVSGCSGWVRAHSTRPLEQMARLVPMEGHSIHCYSIGKMHLIMGISVYFPSNAFGVIGRAGFQTKHATDLKSCEQM